MRFLVWSWQGIENLHRLVKGCFALLQPCRAAVDPCQPLKCLRHERLIEIRMGLRPRLKNPDALAVRLLRLCHAPAESIQVAELFQRIPVHEAKSFCVSVRQLPRELPRFLQGCLGAVHLSPLEIYRRFLRASSSLSCCIARGSTPLQVTVTEPDTLAMLGLHHPRDSCTRGASMPMTCWSPTSTATQLAAAIIGSRADRSWHSLSGRFD